MTDFEAGFLCGTLAAWGFFGAMAVIWWWAGRAETSKEVV